MAIEARELALIERVNRLEQVMLVFAELIIKMERKHEIFLPDYYDALNDIHRSREEYLYKVK